jgi:hypothetical protein
MERVAAHTRSLDRRVQCANFAVCRRSACAGSYSIALATGMQRLLPTGICPRCDDVVGYALDIVDDLHAECPVCYEPMTLGVKWNGDTCTHRFCPSCTHQTLFGLPRPTYELYQSHAGGYVRVHDDGRIARLSIQDDDPFRYGDARVTSCPMCRASLTVQPWFTPPLATNRTVTVIWLYGLSGSGKTRAAIDDLFTKFGEDGSFVYPAIPAPFELDFVGYGGERGMLVDDYDPADTPTERLLRIISGDAAYVDPGHGAPRVPLRVELVYITSCRSPATYFPEGSPVLGLLTAVRAMTA